MAQDFESIALGLRAQKPKAKLPVNEHLELTPAEQSIVARFPNSAEYNITLRLLEGEIQKLETEHFKCYKDEKAFLNSGLVAVAARLMYERFQKEVNFQTAEFTGQQEYQAAELEAAQMSPQDLFKKSFGA